MVKFLFPLVNNWHHGLTVQRQILKPSILYLSFRISSRMGTLQVCFRYTGTTSKSPRFIKMFPKHFCQTSCQEPNSIYFLIPFDRNIGKWFETQVLCSKNCSWINHLKGIAPWLSQKITVVSQINWEFANPCCSAKMMWQMSFC